MGKLPLLHRLLPALAVATALFLPVAAAAQSEPSASQQIHKAHAIAMHGEPKYGPDFKNFDYVNPDAPKGGTIRLGATGSYDSFNPFIIKGDPADGIGFIYETLMASSADEAFTEYGLIAETVEWPEDRSWVIFHLRPEARWQDGEPITADDVVFSFNILLEKGNPFYRFYYQSVAKVEKLDPLTVKFTFKPGENRELPLIMGQLAVLPKHYWETRQFDHTTLEPPLGSGPYKIDKFEPGRYIDYVRDDNYWGKDLPVRRGTNNFDRIHYQYYLDASITRQALKAGDLDYRVENQAKAWAVDYDISAVKNGLLVKQAFRNERDAGMQAFVVNTRRDQFKDPRVREALDYAFDFEWTNKNIFFGQYVRTESYFSNSELASRGLPQGEELDILNRFRGQVPDEVFTQVYREPTTDGDGWPRANLTKAFDLLAQAGWVVRDMKLVNEKTGQQMSFEILLVDAAFERIVLPYAQNLERLGIDVKVRRVDSSQYINRLRAFDFDMIVSGWGQSESPGNEQRNYWGSKAADSPSSRNLIGVKDPVIDQLIDLLIAAPSRESLVQRTRALDRVLLWHHFVVPNWHSDSDRILYWNKFSQPKVIPTSGTDWAYWWWDAEKARLLKERLAQDLSANQQPGSGSGIPTWWLVAGAIAVVVMFFAVRRRFGRAAT